MAISPSVNVVTISVAPGSSEGATVRLDQEEGPWKLASFGVVIGIAAM